MPPPGRGSGRARDGHRRAGFRAVIGEQRVRMRGGFGERSLTSGVARRVAAVVAAVATFETTGAMDGDAKTKTRFFREGQRVTDGEALVHRESAPSAGE